MDDKTIWVTMHLIGWFMSPSQPARGWGEHSAWEEKASSIWDWGFPECPAGFQGGLAGNHPRITAEGARAAVENSPGSS